MRRSGSFYGAGAAAACPRLTSRGAGQGRPWRASQVGQKEIQNPEICFGFHVSAKFYDFSLQLRVTNRTC